MVKTNGFRLTTQTAIQPYPCQPAVEVERDPGDVPHHLPGQNPYLDEFAKKHNLPLRGDPRRRRDGAARVRQEAECSE